ncbi:kinase-like domain-containing protein, partial [Mycena metata]
LLDYDSTLIPIPINKRRFYKALISLSEESGLLPRCLTISGLKHGTLAAGGAFADVYKGSLDGQSIAVKMMRVFEDSDIATLLKQFGREALIWRQLCHPNLLPFVGLYYFQKRMCLVSPWMDNGHIVTFLKKELRDTHHLLSIILDVALGLRDLHDKGIVHGDLTGTNILVAPSHRACIADFGLSSIITAISSLQLRNSSKRPHGTLRYQAPELFQGKHNDLCSDIYAFGCVVFELMTEEPPFSELGDGAVINAVLGGRRPSRPTLCSGTASLDSLWNLLQNCWEELPEMRPTAAQIVERLMGPDIEAMQTESNVDWAHPFTSRVRHHVLGGRALPSVLEVEGMIFGDSEFQLSLH